MNEIDERRRAAVHDRYFRRVELDEHVVDAGAEERREQMLDGFHRHFIARQPGRELDAAQMIDGRRNLVSAQIGTAEANAEVRRRGFEREIDLVAGMKSDSDAGNLTTKRTLCVH